MKLFNISELLNNKIFPYELKDSNNNIVYAINENQFIQCWLYDENNNQIFHINSGGYWWLTIYDNNNELFNINSDEIQEKLKDKTLLRTHNVSKTLININITLMQIYYDMDNISFDEIRETYTQIKKLLLS